MGMDMVGRSGGEVISKMASHCAGYVHDKMIVTKIKVPSTDSSVIRCIFNTFRSFAQIIWLKFHPFSLNIHTTSKENIRWNAVCQKLSLFTILSSLFFVLGKLDFGYLYLWATNGQAITTYFLWFSKSFSFPRNIFQTASFNIRTNIFQLRVFVGYAPKKFLSDILLQSKVRSTVSSTYVYIYWHLWRVCSFKMPKWFF